MNFMTTKGQTDLVASLLCSIDPHQRLKLLSIQNDTGQTPLHNALCLCQKLEYNNADFVTSLLQQLTPKERFSLIFSTDKLGRTPVQTAAQHGQTAFIKLLFSFLSAEQRIQIASARDKNGATSIHTASRGGNPHTVTYLLSSLNSGLQYEAICTQDINGETPIHVATAARQIFTLRSLLQCLKDHKVQAICIQNNGGSTPLQLAAINGDRNAIKALLKDLEGEQRIDVISSMIHTAAQFRHRDWVMKLLLETLSLEQRLILFNGAVKEDEGMSMTHGNSTFRKYREQVVNELVVKTKHSKSYLGFTGILCVFLLLTLSSIFA